MQPLSATPILLTLIYSLPISVWWFAQLSMLSPLPGPALAPVSSPVLQTLVVVQILCLCLFVPMWILHDSAQAGPRSPKLRYSLIIASSVLPAWPLIVMLGLATGVSFASLATTQVLAVTIGFIVATVATLGRKLVATVELQRLINTSVGAIAAACAWLLRDSYLHWLAP